MKVMMVHGWTRVKMDGVTLGTFCVKGGGTCACLNETF